MKKWLFMVILLGCTASHPERKAPVTVIIKPHCGGFEIYATSGALLLEYGAGDSSECSFLNQIIDRANYYRAHPEEWDQPPTPLKTIEKPLKSLVFAKF